MTLPIKVCFGLKINLFRFMCIGKSKEEIKEEILEQLIGGTELENSFDKSCFRIRLQETLCHNSLSSFEKSCLSQ